MNFNQIIGHKHIKNHLTQSVENGRIAHAQLFVGKEGVGALPMAIAYAQHILCSSSTNPEICKVKCEKLQHPDLHFVFPVATNDTVKKHPISSLFLDDWRSFLKENPYGGLFDWLEHIGVEKKQGLISKDEAEDIIKKLSLKSFEGGFKIMIIWMAEAMNQASSNKLLKLIEEPPKDTILLLVSEDDGKIINTITSRCQAIHFPLLTENQICDALIEQENLEHSTAMRIAQQAEGNFNKALHLAHHDSKDLIFEQWFVTWVRAAFKAKGNAAVIQELIEWSETIASQGREVQKQFIKYCLEFFRQALLLNYNLPNLVFFEAKNSNFKLENFAPFIHSQNIINIEKELSDAQYHIERNGNAKIILLDLSIKLTRLLHTKEQQP